jgi:hypothetical protein
MSAIPLIIARLLASEAVWAIVENRVYAVMAPQADPPTARDHAYMRRRLPDCIVQQTTESEEYSLAHEASDYPEARVVVICRGNTATQAITLGDAVLATLKNVHSDVDGVTIFREPIDSTDYTDDAQAFRRLLGFRVRYRS